VGGEGLPPGVSGQTNGERTKENEEAQINRLPKKKKKRPKLERGTPSGGKKEGKMKNHPTGQGQLRNLSRQGGGAGDGIRKRGEAERKSVAIKKWQRGGRKKARNTKRKAKRV